LIVDLQRTGIGVFRHRVSQCDWVAGEVHFVMVGADRLTKIVDRCRRLTLTLQRNQIIQLTALAHRLFDIREHHQLVGEFMGIEG